MNNRKLEALYDLQQLVQKCDKTESVKLDMTELITEMRQRILEAMEKDVYAYHADGWQNDFAQWVEIVLEDSACANDLRKAKTPRSARTVIVKHLKFYKVNAGGREDALGYTS